MAGAVNAIEMATVPPAVLDELSWRVAQGRVDLPLLPSMAMEVTNVANQESADARVIAGLLRKDQALAAHVLRVVASPVYSGRTPIASLEQAVARLGVQKIREIALAIAFRVGVFKLKGFEPQVTALFQHSVAAALFAQEIARLVRSEPEEAFMCGLLHDIGRPVILQATLQILAEQRVRVAPRGVIAATTALHTQVGGVLAESWNLPEAVQVAIRHHHDASPPEAHVGRVCLTALADELARFSFEPERLPEAELRAHFALERLRLPAEALDKLLVRAEGVREAARTLS